LSADRAESFQCALGEAGELSAIDSLRSGAAYEEMFIAHYGRVVALLFRLLGDSTRAEEMASEVLWRAYRRYPGPVGSANIAGWLYRTAANLGIGELRATARRRRYEDAAARMSPAADGGRTPLDELLREETRARVRLVLAALKRWQARILILRASGLSYGELAEALGVKRSSIGTMLARAESGFHRQYLRLRGREE
jgi:RNA polymerase sigma factor (sigma-70 family)